MEGDKELIRKKLEEWEARHINIDSDSLWSKLSPQLDKKSFVQRPVWLAAACILGVVLLGTGVYFGAGPTGEKRGLTVNNTKRTNIKEVETIEAVKIKRQPLKQSSLQEHRKIVKHSTGTKKHNVHSTLSSSDDLNAGLDATPLDDKYCYHLEVE